MGFLTIVFFGKDDIVLTPVEGCAVI